MAKDYLYRRLIASTRWRQLRNQYLTEHPLCEQCLQEGRSIAANCVHHVQPCEEARDAQEMEARMFRYSNLMALCINHHAAIHAQARSHSRVEVIKRQQERLERWKQMHQPQKIT